MVAPPLTSAAQRECGLEPNKKISQSCKQTNSRLKASVGCLKLKGEDPGLKPRRFPEAKSKAQFRGQSWARTEPRQVQPRQGKPDPLRLLLGTSTESRGPEKGRSRATKQAGAREERVPPGLTPSSWPLGSFGVGCRIQRERRSHKYLDVQLVDMLSDSGLGKLGGRVRGPRQADRSVLGPARKCPLLSLSLHPTEERQGCCAGGYLSPVPSSSASRLDFQI